MRLTKSETVILIVAATLLLAGIATRPLFDFDEALYAQSAKEMLTSGNYLTPRWNGEVFFHKPPLLLWFTAGWYQLFGVSEFTARLTSALAGIGSTLLTYKIAARLYGSSVGLIACVILLTSGLFLAEATDGRTDSLLLFSILFTFYAYLKAEDHPQYWYLVCAGLGMAAMTKGIAVIIPVSVIILNILLERRKVDVRFFKGLLIVGLVVGAWHGYMLIVHGRAFFNEYFLHQALARASTRIEMMSGGRGYYFRVLARYFHPWVYLTPIALAFALYKREKSLFLLVWIIFVFGVFNLAGTKLTSYILPMIPALVILTARLFTVVRPAIAVPTFILLAALSWPATLSVLRPHGDFYSASRLARLASRDSGPLLTAPGLYCAPEIRFYSGRRVCASDTRGNTIADLTRCREDEPTNALFRAAERSEVESKYKIQPKGQDGDFIYASISQR